MRELRLELMRQRVRDTALPNADQLMDISHDDASAAANDAEEEDEEELLRSHTLQVYIHIHNTYVCSERKTPWTEPIRMYVETQRKPEVENLGKSEILSRIINKN